MAIEDSGPVAALRRELDEARRAAGDASADGARLRERLTAVERERDEARAVIAAACAALGASATGDLAADVARITAEYHRATTFAGKSVRHLADAHVDLAAAEATLRETTIALERVRGLIAWECTAREEARDGLRSLVDAFTRDGATWVASFEAARVLVATWDAPPAEALEHADWWRAFDAARKEPPACEMCAGRDAVAIVGDVPTCEVCRALGEAPPVEAAAESPHRVGDVWQARHDAEATATVARVEVTAWGIAVTFAAGGRGTPAELEGLGWRRVRCAPAVGDAVRVGDGVGVVARITEDAARAESEWGTALDALDAAWDALGAGQVQRDVVPLADAVRGLVTALREARAVIAAACAALGASATGDLAADVARVVREREEHARDADAAEATLRETTIALERVRGDMRAAEERGVRAGLKAAAAWLVGYGYTHQARDVRALDVASIAARIEAPPVEAAAHRTRNDAMGIWWCDVDGCREHLRGPQRTPVEAAAEPPHRTGDTWRDSSGYEHTVARVADDGARIVLADDAGTGSAGFLEWSGLRRVRCAPAVGDAVRVGDAVGVVARLPEAPLQGVRVDGPGDRMTIAEAGELEMAVRGET